MSADEEPEQQISPVTEEDPNGTHTPVTGGSKSLLSKSTKLSFVGLADAAKERKQTAYKRTKEMEKDIKQFKIEKELDSDDSLVLENESKRRQKPLYEKSPIKPEKFPSKDYNRWENWIKHFKAVAKANGWNDGQKIAAMPTCLTSWAIEEFETIPRRYIEKEPGCYSPRFDELLDVLKPKMQQYRSQRATRGEFKAVKQWENENLREFSRRVRHLADIAFPEKPLRERERDMRDQFIEGLFDSRVQINLYEDERDRDFGETLQRAQELEIIHKTQESIKDRKFDKLRYSQNDLEYSDTVRAGYSNNNQIEEKFAAIETSLTNVASRFDRFENSICQHISKQTEQISKLANSTTSQIETLVQSIKDMSSAMVGAAGSSQQSAGGQSQNVKITQPPPEEAECFHCKSYGHYARQCPNRTKSK